MNNINNVAKIAGIGYLVIFITGFFSNFYVLEGIFDYNNPALSFQNLTENMFLFRLGIVGFILMVVFDIILAWALYILLKPVNQSISLLSAWLRLVNGVIFAAALFNLVNILGFVSNSIESADAGLIQIFIMTDIQSFNNTWLIGLIFFGIHLAFLGYLIIKSTQIPSFIGWLLLIASAGYITDSFANFLLPEYAEYKNIFSAIVILPGIIGELSLTFWLLIKGGSALSRE